MRIIADHGAPQPSSSRRPGLTPSTWTRLRAPAADPRRAVRHGMNIGRPVGATSKIAEVIVGQYASVYPELERNRATFWSI
jgi:hypothetical protein